MQVVSSLTLDRTGLALSPLVINNDPFDGAFTYPDDGLAEPNFTMRVRYAPDSAFTPGRLVLGSVMDGSVIPLTIAVKGTSQANLTTLKAELLAALAQLSYTVTITVGGVDIGTWPAGPSVPSWGVVDHGMAQIFLASAVVAIPVNPPV